MPVALKALWKQFEPTPLPPNDPRYVETAAERHVPALATKFDLALSGDTAMPLLFTGVVGDGKTSTLNYLRSQWTTEGRFVAYAAAEDYIDPTRASFEDVVLLLLAIVDRSLTEHFAHSIDKPWYVKLWNEFCEIADLPEELQAEIKVGPFAKVVAKTKKSPSAHQRVLQGLRETKRKNFLDVANEYLREARAVVREETGGELVAILDNLDTIQGKLSTGQDRGEAIFIDRAYQLKELDAKVVYTVRLDIVRAHCADLPILYGSPPIIVPMLAVRDREGETSPEGLQRLREILALRIRAHLGAFAGDLDVVRQAREGALNEAAVRETVLQVFETEEAASQLCLSSGGHMRELVLLTREAIGQALTKKRQRITRDDVEAGVLGFDPFRRAAARKYKTELRHVAETKSIAELEIATQRELLRLRMIHEHYDHDFWYDVCPMVAPILK
jgi:hypothetical protein